MAAYIIITPSIFHSTGMIRGGRRVFWIKVGDSDSNIYNRVYNDYPNRNPDFCAAMISLNYDGQEAPGTLIEKGALGGLEMARARKSEWRALYVDDQTFPHVKKALWKMMKKFDITHSGWKLTEEAYNFIEHTESLSRVYSLQEAIQVVRDGISPGIAGNPAVFSNPSTTYPLISVIVIPNLDEGGFKLPNGHTVFWVTHEYTETNMRTPAYKYFTHTPSFSHNAFDFPEALDPTKQGYVKGSDKALDHTKTLFHALENMWDIFVEEDNQMRGVRLDDGPEDWIEIELKSTAGSPTFDWFKRYVTTFHIHKGGDALATIA